MNTARCHDDDAAACALVSAHDHGARGAALPLVVALHDRGGDAFSGIALSRALLGPDRDVVALQAARPCNPLQSNLKSDPAWSGFSWYLGDDATRPDAASFGDALVQVDLCCAALGRDFLLVGEGQGGVLALALALHAPARLLGLHLRHAGLARIEGWDAPLRDLSALEIRVHDGRLDDGSTTLLTSRGAKLQTGQRR